MIRGLRRSDTLKALFLITTVLGMASQPLSAKKVEPPLADTCDTNSISESCIFVDLASALGNLTYLPDWIATAAEYSEALAAIDQNAEATKLLTTAYEASSQLSVSERLAARVILTQSAAEIGNFKQALSIIESEMSASNPRCESESCSDAYAKLAGLLAKAGDITGAMQQANALPVTGKNQASFRDRTYREIARYAAKHGDFDTALAAINFADAGFSYYRSVALTEVATEALVVGNDGLAKKLLIEAEDRARAEVEGYFAAGALRDVAAAYAQSGDTELSIRLFNDAVSFAKTATSAEMQARAISRIATRMADIGQSKRGSELIPIAIQVGEKEPAELMRNYVFYEVSGSAAFVGSFEIAMKLADQVPDTKFGSSSSLHDSTLRDVSWGLVRAGRVAEGLTLARSISSARERGQALARIIRLLRKPQMNAFPRYL